jgi:hypothetical protein
MPELGAVDLGIGIVYGAAAGTVFYVLGSVATIVTSAISAPALFAVGFTVGLAATILEAVK